MNKGPFIIERIFHAPPDAVWKAISNSEEMKQWYFDIPGFRPEVGAVFHFEGGPEGHKPYLHRCKVTEVTPLKKTCLYLVL